MAKTFAQIKAYARQKAKMTNSDFIETTEEADVINDAYRCLYHMLVDSMEDYYVVATSFTLTGGISTYAIPATAYKIAGVDISLDSARWHRLNPFNFQDRNRGSRALHVSGIAVAYPSYRVIGANIVIDPQKDGVYRAWIVPEVTALSLDADALVVDCERFWKYIALSAAVSYLTDEESDTSQLERQLASEIAQIEKFAASRQMESGTIAMIENYGDNEGVVL